MNSAREKRVIVGFSGPIGCGKTTAATALEQIGFTRVRFAGPLKAMMAALGLGTREIDGDRKELSCALLGGKTPRFAMQTLGTEWGRETIHDNIWINAWCNGVNSLPDGDPVVVDDVRFPNEAQAIHDLGGIVIGVSRFGCAPGTGCPTVHSSEQFDFTPDFLLVNEHIDVFRSRVVALAAARLELQQRDAA